MWNWWFLLCSWLTGTGASDSAPFIITDHPARRKAEERSQLGPLGQPKGPSATLSPGQSRSATWAFRSDEDKAPTWTLSEKGIPCHPLQQEGKTYHGCHPDGWCCLDITCSKTDHCDMATKDQATPGPPLRLPRDPVTTPCELDAGGETFHWDPEEDLNLMFLLLQEDVEGLQEEDLESLVKLSSSQPLRLVLMSYKTSKDEIQELMSKTQQQLEPLIAALTPEERDRAKQSFVLVSQPAWHISFDRCWLPSVTHSWSKEVTLLQFSSEYDFSVSTQPQSIRGDWAKDGGLEEALSKPLRWAGGLCEEQEMDPSWPAPSTALSGSIALVARGSCSHYHKARSAQDRDAAGIVIFSYSEQTVAMSCAAPDPCDEVLQIPVLMISRSLGERLLEELFPNVTSDDQGPATEREVTTTLRSQRQGPDLVGVLGGGGLWYNSPIGMSRLADELIGMEYRRKLLQRREELSQSGDVLRIEVFQLAAFPGGLTFPWPASDAQRIRDGKYTELEVELALDCKDHLDDNCPPWDHELNLYLCIEGVSARPACHDRRLSVARWVTPYGREAHWFSANTAALPLLSSAEAVAGKGTLHLHTWQHYTVSLVFWFRRTSNPSPVLPRSQMPLWLGGPFDLSYNPLHQPVTFELPPATQRVTLSALITGHGWGVDEDNCAEFCDHSHHFSVNGVTTGLTKAHPTAGNQDGCKTKVLLGVVPNQYGTWPFGRAGWCPGQHVDWWEVDVTQWLQEGSNTLTYHAYFNGTDYEPQPGGLEDDLGFPAEIHLASVLTFYSEEGHQQPVELKLKPLQSLENSRRSVLFP